MCNKIEKTMFANIELFLFFQFSDQRKSGFQRRRQPFIVDEELDDIDIDDIWNLEDSRRLVFIVKECGNSKVVN